MVGPQTISMPNVAPDPKITLPSVPIVMAVARSAALSGIH